MARKLDIILVIDLECACWDGAPPEGEEAEIIEIGLAPVDVATVNRVANRTLLVRPERSRVSDFCTGLTTLTQEQVEEGISFAEACRILAREYEGRDRTWASFGDFDRRQFERQCQSRGIGYPLGVTHLNVKNLLALSLGLAREAGMDEGLHRMGLPLEGVHHRGGDDAWNIAAILCHLLRRLRGGDPVGQE